MMTIGIWRDFTHKMNFGISDWLGNFCRYYDGDIVWLLMWTILLTPLSLSLDMLFLPFEILYFICSKIVDKVSDE